MAAYRELAAARPDVFRPDLAMSLGNQSDRLADLGRPEEALAAIGEAVAAYRELAAARPDVFRPDLARSLIVSGKILSELLRVDKAVPPLAEALNVAVTPQERPLVQAAVDILRDVYQQDSALVVDTWRRATGTDLPDWLTNAS